MKTKLYKLFMISRPISWVNTAYPFGAAYLISGGRLDWVFLLGCIYFLIPYNLLMYGVNDIFDYESDIKNPRKGGIEGMREQKAFHPTIALYAGLTNLPFLIYLLSIGNAISRITLIVLIFFVLAYSLKYLRFKERPLLDSFTSSTHFFGPMVFALAINGQLLDGLPYIIAFMLWGMASQAFGAVQDIIPDRQAKIASIATYFGASATVRLSIVLYIVSSVIVMTQPGLSWVAGLSGLLYVLNIYKFKDTSDKNSAETNSGWKRFIWINYLVGFIITICLILTKIF